RSASWNSMRSTSSAAGFAATVTSLCSVLPSFFTTLQSLLHSAAYREPRRRSSRANLTLIGSRRNRGARWDVRGASTGFRVITHGKIAASKRVLIVEDELMIRMLLEGMLTDLGHSVAAEAGALDEAISLAKQAEFDLAVLDVNLNGTPVTPV